MVQSGDLVGVLSEHHIDICHTTSGHGLDRNLSCLLIVFDPPILSGSEICKDTKPCLIGGLAHVEWVGAVQIFAWSSSVLDGIWLISRPQGVDAIWKEEVSDRPLGQSHDTLGASSSEGGGIDLVEVLAENHAVELPDHGTSSIHDADGKRSAVLLHHDVV